MRLVTACRDKKTGEPKYYNQLDRFRTVIKSWKKKNKNKAIKVYRKYFKEFKIKIDKETFRSKVVLAIGSGPWGGVLRYIKNTKTSIAIDCLMDVFKDHKIYDFSNGKSITCDSKKIPLENSTVDIVFCLNMLDHCDEIDTPLKTINEIYRLLKQDGVLYFCVHLRKDDELSLLHLYSLDEKDLIKYFINFEPIMWRIEESDIISGKPYKTFWGIFKRK